jgi:hypothetical protein
MTKGTTVLYQAVTGARASGEAERLWTRRGDCGCLLAAGFQIRGGVFVIAPARIDEDGREAKTAWRAEDLPQDALLGCKHKGRSRAIPAEIHPEGIVSQATGMLPESEGQD